jgi:hypothetical protein
MMCLMAVTAERGVSHAPRRSIKRPPMKQRRSGGGGVALQIQAPPDVGQRRRRIGSLLRGLS